MMMHLPSLLERINSGLMDLPLTLIQDQDSLISHMAQQILLKSLKYHSKSYLYQWTNSVMDTGSDLLLTSQLECGAERAELGSLFPD